jgi:hypothetical protein
MKQSIKDRVRQRMAGFEERQADRTAKRISRHAEGRAYRETYMVKYRADLKAQEARIGKLQSGG